MSEQKLLPPTTTLWVCPTCGSPQIQWTAWVYANTGNEAGGDPPSGYSWCDTCSENGRDVDAEFKYAGSAPWSRIAAEGLR